MNVYFVRHGETNGNATGMHQTFQTPLSPKGLKQAAFVGKRFTTIPVDVILSSPFERTKQTAEQIQAVVNKDIVFVDDLREIKRPTEIENKYISDPEVIKIKQQIDAHWHDPNWHYSDEDNFFDLRDQSIHALKSIEERSEENIIVVSHGMKLRMIIAVMIFGEELTPEEFENVDRFFKTTNTGVTLCVKEARSSWRMHTWNDVAHLEELLD